ncbi:(d)CMP kinase [bacterium]|nr:(d)CMP kinase [bacterium]
MPKKRKTVYKGVIVSIDGPSGAGKSTVSRQLAEALEGMLLDTGGMYRSVAYFGAKEGLSRSGDLSKLARRLEFDVDKQTKVLLVDGRDLGSKLRTEEISRAASDISKFITVRKALTRCQRRLANKWAKHFPVVVEGRDIGTVVFPKAPFKFFVTASEEVRAKRRMTQLKKAGIRGVTMKKTLRENAARDRQDTQRKVAPLRVAEDAVVVDTSSMGISQVVHFMHDHIRGRLNLT